MGGVPSISPVFRALVPLAEMEGTPTEEHQSRTEFSGSVAHRIRGDWHRAFASLPGCVCLLSPELTAKRLSAARLRLPAKQFLRNGLGAPLRI